MTDTTKRRPRPQHPDSARLIYQAFSHRMLAIGRGNEVYEWNYVPSDVKEAFEDAVSSHLNWLSEGIIRTLADRLRVPHYTERDLKRVSSTNV